MIRTIRNTIVAGINKLTSIPVIDTDNPHKKPPYPYYSYKFTTTRQNIGERGNLNYSFVESKEPQFKYDVLEELSFQPYAIISFNAYAKGIIDSQEYAIIAWEWFKLKGKQELADKNLVVVDVGNIQDRTIQIADFYEYRQGFDVTIGYLHAFEHRSETIEEYEVKGEII